MARFVVVIRLISDLRAKTDKRSSTYKSRYWFTAGMERMRVLYAAMAEVVSVGDGGVEEVARTARNCWSVRCGTAACITSYRGYKAVKRQWRPGAT